MLKRTAKYIIVGFIIYKVALLIKAMGFHKNVYLHHPGNCRQFEALNTGSEDMERIPGDKVLITSGLRFNGRYSEHYRGRSGKVYMFDFNYPDEDPEQVTIKDYSGDMAELDFHGISSWINPNTGVVSVFIVNHMETYDTIEIFLYHDGENELHHRRTVKEESFRLLNDVVGVGDEAFYTTRYAHSRYNWGKLEQALQLHWGGVLYYDGQQLKEVLAGFLLPNGISRSHDNRYIYLVNTGEQEVNVYERAGDNSLKLKQSWSTNTFPDNIIVDGASGELWVGCHPIGWKVALYLEDPALRSPSQILRLKTIDGLIVSMTEPFTDEGSLISASAVAVHSKDKLLIGSIASQTVICDAPSATVQ